jgi:hypothetical protein
MHAKRRHHPGGPVNVLCLDVRPTGWCRQHCHGRSVDLGRGLSGDSVDVRTTLPVAYPPVHSTYSAFFFFFFFIFLLGASPSLAPISCHSWFTVYVASTCHPNIANMA